MNAFQRGVRLGAALCLAAVLSACGTPMGLTKQTTQLDLSQKSIVLATFEASRSNGRLMLDPRRVHLIDKKSPDGKGVVSLALDEEGMEKDSDKPRKLVLLRMALEPGKHRLTNVSGTITGFLATGGWAVPLDMEFEVPPQSVVYLGRISATLRERKDNEFRAGGLIPLIDQAVLGISNGTFDVTISDQSATDLPRFKDNYSVLRNQSIQTLAVPPYDRTVFDRAFMGDTSTTKAPPAPAKAN